MKDRIYLDIRLDTDKRAIAGILVANGYCVRITKINDGKRAKNVIEISMDGKPNNE